MGRRQLAAFGIGAALVLGACSTDREVTRPEPEPVTTEGLSEALLTVDDLPEGFTEVDDPQTTMSTEWVPEHECDDALADLEADDEVSAEFTEGARTLSSTVASFPGEGAALEQLFRDIQSDCAAVIVSEQGLAIRTGSLDFGVLSDDTLPIRIEVEPDSGAIEERDVILVREGDLVHVIRLTGPRPSDKALLDSVVRPAIGRLGLLYDETT